MSKEVVQPRKPKVRPWLIAVLLVAISALLLAVGFLVWHKPPPKPSAEQARALRTAAVVDVAPAPLPTGTPLLGPEGNDSDGYPLKYVDKPAIRSLLWHNKFALLDKYFDEFEDGVEADYTKEYWASDAVDALSSVESELGARLDAWVAMSPDSFGAHCVRGSQWYEVAWARRGGQYTRNTPRSDLDAMNDALVHASKELDRALSIRPNAVWVMRTQMWIAALHGDRQRIETIIAKATAGCPGCLRVRLAYVLMNEPRWGGSREAMRAYAKKDLEKNPRFRFLTGYADLDESDDLERANKWDEASTVVARATALGDHPDFLAARADIALQRKDWAGALVDLDKAVAMRPASEGFLGERARALYGLKRYEDAGRDLLGLLRVDPTSETGRELHPATVTALVYQGWEDHKANKRDDALRIYDLAAELAPTDGQVLQRRAAIIVGSDNPDVAQLQKAATDHPDDFRLHQQLDYAMSKTGDFTHILEMWNEYLERHPDEARGYLERGGTYYHLGRPDDARADAQRACDMGITEGCTQAKRFGTR